MNWKGATSTAPADCLLPTAFFPMLHAPRPLPVVIINSSFLLWYLKEVYIFVGMNR